MLKTLLAHPLTRGLDIDDPATTELRTRIIRQKRFLRRIYDEWYAMITARLPAGPGPVLELGSGAGFLDEVIPGLITSEVFRLPSVRLVLDGQQLPFGPRVLRGIVMCDVFHHLPDTPSFLSEAARCTRPGGVVVMIEPWVTPFSKLIYTRLHHEPFRTRAVEWTLPKGGPLSNANGALPWICFERDRTRFDRAFPAWQVEEVHPFMPFRYLVSGGVSMRSLMPGFSFGLWRGIEQCLQPWMKTWAMFALIVLRRASCSEAAPVGG